MDLLRVFEFPNWVLFSLSWVKWVLFEIYKSAIFNWNPWMGAIYIHKWQLLECMVYLGIHSSSSSLSH